MTSAPSSNRLQTGLLMAIAILLALMLLGLLVGGLVAMRELPVALRLAREMRQELAGMRADLKATREATQKLGAEVERMQATAVEASSEASARQRALKQELLARSRRTQRLLDEIQGRRARVAYPAPANPLAKLDAVIDLNTIMADELLILSRHLAETQAELANVLAPLPLQKKAETRR